MTLKRVLAAFDMDNTINTKFLESAVFEKINPISRDRYIEGKKPWEERVMNAMSMHSYNLQQVTKHISNIGIVPGMKEMFANLKSKGVDIIICSGGNDLMVKIYLEQQGISQYFSTILANRMSQSSGMLMYRPVSKLSPCIPACKNYFCKRHHLSEYVKGKNYDKVFLVGDGQNDFCGFCYIKSGGAMIRSPSEMTKIFKSKLHMKSEISCPIYEWSDGHDLNSQFEIAISAQ